MAHVCHHKRAILNAKVGMRKVGQHSYNLVLVAEGCDQGTHGFAPSKIMEKLQFVLDANWAAGNIDLLQRHIARRFASSGASIYPAALGRRIVPFLLFVVLCLAEDIPVVLVMVVQQILCLVDSGERPLIREPPSVVAFSRYIDS